MSLSDSQVIDSLKTRKQDSLQDSNFARVHMSSFAAKKSVNPKNPTLQTDCNKKVFAHTGTNSSSQDSAKSNFQNKQSLWNTSKSFVS